MNSLIKKISFVLLISSYTVIAQVGIGTTNPNTSSMLDIQSTSKGILIPRVTTTQKNVISGVEGLLVFDSTTKSFWYYNNGWIELTTGTSATNKIQDADGNTKIELDKNADEDKIRFSTANVAKDASKERMIINNTGEILMGTDLSSQTTTTFQIDSDGIIKLGNKGASTLTGGPDNGVESDATGLENYTKITTDGSLSYVGNATRWEDLKVPVNSVKIKDLDVDDVKYELFAGGIALLLFKSRKDKESSVMFSVQMPHGWKEGSNIYPHVHWSSKSNIADGAVKWGLEYQWKNVGENFTNSTGTVITGSTIAAPNTPSGVTAFEHVITPLGTGGIDATGRELSSMLICRLYRDPSDSYTGEDVFLLEFDFHYQVDSDGSNQEYSKQD